MAHRNGKSSALLKVSWRLGSNQKVVHVLGAISSSLDETWQIIQQSTCAPSSQIVSNQHRNKWHFETKMHWSNDTWCDYYFDNLILFHSIFLLEIDFDTYRERFPAIHWPNIGLDELTHAPNTGKQYDRNSAAAAAAKHEISLPYREISTEQNPESSFRSFSASLTTG